MSKTHKETGALCLRVPVSFRYGKNIGLLRVFIIMMLLHVTLFGLDFSLIKKGQNESNTTLLVIGGIQGDEPGGFNAAAILSTHYTIEKGHVWIVPNLNFSSIIYRSRGLYGDMNRKFATLDPKDPEYDTIKKIQSIITDKAVDLVVNLHDGSGFYRPEYRNWKFSPYRWGQSCIIDQEHLDCQDYGNLKDIAAYVTNSVNKKLVNDAHRFHIKNTKTREGDMEMAKTLTYYAINHGKPAFGNEATKEFDTHYRAYYHLLALEAYMDYMGIQYKRNFELTPEGVKKIIEGDYLVTLFDKIVLPTKDVRQHLRFIPVDKTHSKTLFSSDNPLICAVKGDNGYQIHYGNHYITTVSPQFFQYDDSLSNVQVDVDGNMTQVKPGSIVEVGEYFKVMDKKGYRINVIGYSNSKKSETDIAIFRRDIPKRFSVDKMGTLYRVEVYKGEKFSGMFLVKFSS